MKTVFITGGGSGIGAGLAAALRVLPDWACTATTCSARSPPTTVAAAPSKKSPTPCPRTSQSLTWARVPWVASSPMPCSPLGEGRVRATAVLSRLEEGPPPASLDSSRVVVSPQTRFHQNQSRVGAGQVPLPEPF